MTQRFTPPTARRLSAIAIAAALTAFAGLAGAQTGYVTSKEGGVVTSGQGGCVRSAQATPTGPCVPMTSASSTSAAAAPRSASSTQLAQADTRRASASSAAAGSSAASGSTSAGAPRAAPGYVSSTDGRVVTNAFGNCVRSGQWSAANAAEPCDRVPRADVPPTPVAAAVPAPEPMVQPAPAPQALAEPPRPVIQKLSLSTDVLFDFGKSELKDSGKARLDQLASEIKDADVDEIVAVGHADRIASEDYNQKLSEARAQAVKDYLSERGAKSNVITAQGKGESQPVTGDDCKKLGAEKASNKKLVACLQPDRRVEIEVLGSRQVAGGAPAAGTGSSTPASGSTTGSSATTR